MCCGSAPTITPRTFTAPTATSAFTPPGSTNWPARGCGSRAFCNSPVCTASRQSFLTGRYPHSVGVTLLSTPLAESETTLAEVLGDGRLRTAAIGKMHFNSRLSHGFDKRLDLADCQRALAAREREPLPDGVEVLPVWKPFRDPARIWLNGFCRPYAAHDVDMAGTWMAGEAARGI